MDLQIYRIPVPLSLGHDLPHQLSARSVYICPPRFTGDSDQAVLHQYLPESVYNMSKNKSGNRAYLILLYSRCG